MSNRPRIRAGEVAKAGVVCEVAPEVPAGVGLIQTSAPVAWEVAEAAAGRS